MKNTFGQSVTVTLFGESHGDAIGAVLDGIAPGVPVDTDYIADCLAKRRPHGKISSARREPDNFKIISGVRNGKTCGTPLCIIIENRCAAPSDYECTAARPSHADFTAFVKHHGYADMRGGGHFSGRLTAPLVAVGAICRTALDMCGVSVGTHIFSCGSVTERHFAPDPSADLAMLRASDFPVLDKASASLMRAEILAARSEDDSVGGITETAVTGLPAGIGEPWFDSLESTLSHMMFSVPAVKGIEFGDGFAVTSLRASQANDAMRMSDGSVVCETNHSGGICGGISNGMPVIFRCAVKPTPSIGITQNTVDLAKLENTTVTISGRHDPAIIHRAVPVIDSAAAIVLCDMLALRYGTDFIGGIK